MRLAAVTAALVALGLSACAPDVAPIARGEFALTDADSPRALEGADWQPITLPDRWSDHHPGIGGVGWYRFTIPSAPPAESRWAIYLPRVRMNAAVYVNGAWVGDGGRFEPPVAQNWSRPLYFEFPRELLHADGSDVVHVRLFSYPYDGGGLGRVYIAPHEQLSASYARQRALEVDMARVVLFATIVVIFLLGGLLASRHRREYVWLLPCAVCLAIHSLAGQVEEIPVSYGLTRWALHSAVDTFAVALACFVHRWARVERRKLERVLWALLVIVLSVSALADPALFLPVALLSHSFAIVVGTYAFLVVGARLRREGGTETAVGATFGLGALLLGIAGVAPYLGLVPPESPRVVVLLGPWMLLGLGCLLAIRYARAAREAALTQAELVARVRDREQELEREYARTQALERDRAVATERERLMREMHDGLGGQLASMLHSVQHGDPAPQELEEALAATLDDMRMVIDSLDPDVDSVPTLLGMMRVRLARRIQGAGVALEWKVTDVPHLPWLGRGELRHVQRIVQEAITNTLRHAGAARVSVETDVSDDGDVIVRVCDDGRGIPSEPELGRGLQNMKHRAEEMGAQLSIAADEQGRGTRVVLLLPLEPRA